MDLIYFPINCENCLSPTSPTLYNIHYTYIGIPTALYNIHYTSIGIPTALYNIHYTYIGIPTALYNIQYIHRYSNSNLQYTLHTKVILNNMHYSYKGISIALYNIHYTSIGISTALYTIYIIHRYSNSPLQYTLHTKVFQQSLTICIIRT